MHEQTNHIVPQNKEGEILIGIIGVFRNEIRTIISQQKIKNGTTTI